MEQLVKIYAFYNININKYELHRIFYCKDLRDFNEKVFLARYIANYYPNKNNMQIRQDLIPKRNIDKITFFSLASIFEKEYNNIELITSQTKYNNNKDLIDRTLLEMAENKTLNNMDNYIDVDDVIRGEINIYTFPK